MRTWIQRKMDRLTLGFLHLNIKHKNLAFNRQNLIQHARQAAKSGAQILIAPELSLSGYSFSSREDIEAFTETAEGQTIQALKNLAKEFGVYFILGFAERESHSNIFYNSAIAINPSGKSVCLYRKITAETRWACPGKAAQQNTFSTPWGTIGLAICSDTYFGLIPRAAALKNTDLLVVPSNWPALSLDPALVWKSRAIENNMFVAAANRGGEDLTMSCHEASTCVFSPTGETLLSEKSRDSAVFYADLPLKNGKLERRQPDWLATRRPENYSAIYLDMRYATDLTAYYNLPKPGALDVLAFTKASMPELSVQSLSAFIEKLKPTQNPRLLLMPIYNYEASFNLDEMAEWAKSHQLNLCFGTTSPKGDLNIVFIEATGKMTLYLGADQNDAQIPLWIDIEHVRLALAFTDELIHPEFAMACAKLGCDMVVCPTSRLDESLHITLGAKTIEQVAVAVAGQNLAFVAEPPVGHDPWKEYRSEANVPCSALLSTESYRKKHFHERYDFELLLHSAPSIQAPQHANEVPIPETMNPSGHA